MRIFWPGKTCCSLALLAWDTCSHRKLRTVSASFLSPTRNFVTGSVGSPLQNLQGSRYPTSESTVARMSSESNTETDVDVAGNLAVVRERIAKVCQELDLPAEKAPRLVAVSKTKPVPLLQAAYDAGQRIFGENYAQELVEKVPQLPKDVTWHYIGALQSNKASKLVSALGDEPHRLVIETVSTIKLANKLNNAVPDVVSDEEEKKQLRVFVQVNTSGEESKSGVQPLSTECIELCKHIHSNEACPKLKLQGLMTIGAPGDLSCFDTLMKCRDQVAEALASEDADQEPVILELSMGMSGDYEEAIRAGATNVRVGSTIFGQRDYSNKN